MINVPAVRAGLAELLDAQFPEVKVQRAGVNASAVFPTIILGQPSWSPSSAGSFRFDRLTFAIACVVSRAGSDATTIDNLEELWPAVAGWLDEQTKTNQELGGLCRQSELTRAEFSRFPLQGTDYPAQILYLDLFG